MDGAPETTRRPFLDRVRAGLDRIATLPLVLVAIIVILVGVIVIQALNSPEIKTLGLLAASTVTPTAPAPQTYHNELYYFRAEPDAYVAALNRAEDVAGCQGVVFWSDPRGPLYRGEAAKQIRICYVADVMEETAETLRQALDKRAALIQEQLDGADIGVVKHCDIGRQDLPCIERHLQGGNALGTSGVEWYQAVVSYGRRLFAFEATGNADDWEEHERAAQRLLSTLRFDDGVIPP